MFFFILLFLFASTSVGNNCVCPSQAQIKHEGKWVSGSDCGPPGSGVYPTVHNENGTAYTVHQDCGDCTRGPNLRCAIECPFHICEADESYPCGDYGESDKGKEFGCVCVVGGTIHDCKKTDKRREYYVQNPPPTAPTGEPTVNPIDMGVVNNYVESVASGCITSACKCKTGNGDLRCHIPTDPEHKQQIADQLFIEQEICACRTGSCDWNACMGHSEFGHVPGTDIASKPCETKQECVDMFGIGWCCLPAAFDTIDGDYPDAWDNFKGCTPCPVMSFSEYQFLERHCYIHKDCKNPHTPCCNTENRPFFGVCTTCPGQEAWEFYYNGKWRDSTEYYYAGDGTWERKTNAPTTPPSPFPTPPPLKKNPGENWPTREVEVTGKVEQANGVDSKTTVEGGIGASEGGDKLPGGKSLVGDVSGGGVVNVVADKESALSTTSIVFIVIAAISLLSFIALLLSYCFAASSTVENQHAKHQHHQHQHQHHQQRRSSYASRNSRR